jgi:rifampicin phosphotransferase
MRNLIANLPDRRVGASVRTALATGAGLLVSSPAFAIPSPELVIGSISSMSQLFALGTAMLGGGAAAMGARASWKKGSDGKAARTAFRTAGVLLLLFVGSLAVNYLQYSRAAAAKLDRLQATLNRPAQAPGTKILDPNLIETSYAAQSASPLGITTADAAELLAQSQAGKRQVLFIDVRENAERAMGSLPGSIHVRFPDLLNSDVDLSNTEVVLFCYNGNRSSETAVRLAKLGIKTRFIIGGIEKWIVEGRPFSDKSVRSLADLRAIPDYENKDVLLDTPEVKTLVAEQGIQFVDVRYPADFEASYLPGAINIPLRGTPSDKLARMIEQLPQKPIVAACYDRRSCFISQVLGLELTKAGFDYRGRYTLPWEYFTPKPMKPYVAAWLEQSQKSLWQKTVEKLAGKVGDTMQAAGLLVAVLMVALVSRILVLPISLKAEKDQIISARHADELKDLKARLKDDPKRMAQAMKLFYRDHGLTPMRNMLALAFLPLMALGLSAVQMAAPVAADSFLWIERPGNPDPLYILPVVFAALGAFYFQIAVAKTVRGRKLSWLIGVPALFALAFILSAAGALYLISSIVLLLVQRAYVVGLFGTALTAIRSRLRAWRVAGMGEGIIPLSHSEQLQQCGNKAYRLSLMQQHSIAVPDGVVLDQAFLTRFLRAPKDRQEKLLDRIWAMVRSERVAVRSSAGSEDGEEKSFAGVFESYLCVTRDILRQAILDVSGSFDSTRAYSYGSEDLGRDDGNILIQRMVDAQFAGVLFTQDPQAPGLAIIEMVKGTADDLVSGRVIPQTFRYGRLSHLAAEDTQCAIDHGPLLAIGQKAEQIFGGPQDIEWTWREGRFEIVQSRDITTLHQGTQEQREERAEWVRLLRRFGDAAPEAPVLEQDEMAEVLPRPTPLSLSYMQALWANGGSVDLACRRLELSYHVPEGEDGHLVTVFGRLYSDIARKTANSVVLSKRLSGKLKRNSSKIEQDFLHGFMPHFNRQMVILEATDFSELSAPDLSSLLRDQFASFIAETHTEVEIINIAASFYLSVAATACMQAGIDPATHLSSATSAGPAAAFSHAALLPQPQRRPYLLAELGHRAVFDYELNEPRYSETPDLLDALCIAPPEAGKESSHSIASGALSDPALPAELAEPVRTAGQYQVLKEQAKHYSLRQLSVMRRAILALDDKLALEGLCFFLTFEELGRICDANLDTYREIAQARRLRYRSFLKSKPLPTSLSLTMLERASGAVASQPVPDDGKLRGTRISGTGEAQGRLFVASHSQAESGAPLKGFRDGDILACPMVHPAWLPYVLRSGGVISEVGGWLSHIAIVAREHDIPMIVGLHSLEALSPGAHVVLQADGEVVVGPDQNWQAARQAAE